MGRCTRRKRPSRLFPLLEASKRRDFRDLPIVTIDGETARDFDDAVLVRRLENGNFELQVHIADVAHYVTARIARSIRKRGCAGPAFIFPIAPCPCCRWSFRPTFAACARKWTGW